MRPRDNLKSAVKKLSALDLWRSARNNKAKTYEAAAGLQKATRRLKAEVKSNLKLIAG
nr:MAG TPA: hypothetical protein [Caudoviricetes sp.]